MKTASGRIKALLDPRPRHVQAERRAQLGWGAAMALVIVVMLAVVAGIYLLSPGTRTIRANFEEAGMIRTGDSVRVAGIPTGNVKSVDLKGSRVEVTMTVGSDVKLGSETSAAVKMLTVVGGYYIDLTPAGTAPLGADGIPTTRTSVPYSLMETFQSLTPKLSKVDGNPVRDLLVEVQTGFSENPGALRDNLTVMQSMLTNLNRNQETFGGLLRVAKDYAQELNVQGDVITQLVYSMSGFVTELERMHGRWWNMWSSLTQVFERLGTTAAAYDQDLDPLVRQIDAIGREFGPLLQRYTPLINQGRDLIHRLEGMVAPDGTIILNDRRLLSSNLCIPVPGVTC